MDFRARFDGLDGANLNDFSGKVSRRWLKTLRKDTPYYA